MPATPYLLTFQQSFDGGIVRDVARDAIPDNGLYECRNMLPGLNGAPLRKRAGWTYASNALSGASFVVAGIHAPYLSGDQLVVIDSTGNISRINNDLTATLIGTGFSARQNPVFFKDYVVVRSNGGSALERIDSSGAGVDLLSGPNAQYVVPHKDRLVAANTSANPNRVFYSNANDPDGWDLTNNTFDFDRPITGMASISTGVIVFSDRSCYILRGTTPGADGDITETFLFPIGLQDAFSITYWNDFAIWANQQGVFMTDGASLIDLTTTGGIKSAWAMPREVDANGNTIGRLACGVVGDYLVVTGLVLANGTETTWVCHIPNRAWYRLTNYKFRTYFSVSPGSPKGLYGGSGVIGKVAQVGKFDTAGTSTDGDTTSVIPYLETKYYHPYYWYRRRIVQLPLSRMRFAFISYILRYPSTPATITVAPQAQSGSLVQGTTTALANGSTSSTQGDGFKRRLFPINEQGSGVWLSITTDTCADFALDKIELQYWPLPTDAVMYGS